MHRAPKPAPSASAIAATSESLARLEPLRRARATAALNA